MQKFFIGWHMPNSGASGTSNFSQCCISVNRLLKRKSPFSVKNWILDSGAFTRLSGLYNYKGHLSIKQYAAEIWRWRDNGNLMAAVVQDFMCESLVLAKTGLDIATHQRLTIFNYDRLLQATTGANVYIMPVLQGWSPKDYVRHLKDYGDRIPLGAWVGVGSVCKRQGSPKMIEAILKAVLNHRSDLRLHGFGVKKTALEYLPIWQMLYSADSQAHGLIDGRGSNKYVRAHDPLAALEYARSISPKPYQLCLVFCKLF